MNGAEMVLLFAVGWLIAEIQGLKREVRKLREVSKASTDTDPTDVK